MKGQIHEKQIDGWVHLFLDNYAALQYGSLCIHI